jgi:chemotaxis protein MotA
MGIENPHQIEDLLDKELELVEHERKLAPGAIGSMADGMPALGIVAAVLGVITTMGNIDKPPTILGGLIGAALVGTFLGVLMAYGFIGPISQFIDKYVGAEMEYLKCIKATIIAHVQGYAPTISIEFGRKQIPLHDRPTFKELEEAINAGA